MSAISDAFDELAQRNAEDEAEGVGKLYTLGEVHDVVIKEREAECERVLAFVDALRVTWEQRSRRDHRCPNYESCAECPIDSCYEARAEELADLAAKLRGGEL